MRIRKRQLLFSLSPVTFSDPNSINRSPEVVQLNDATTTSPKHSCKQVLDHPQPSVQALPTNGCDDSLTDERQHKKQPFLIEDERRQVKEEEGPKSNDTRKESISSAPISTELFVSSSPSCSSYKQDWRWKDGEKAFPLKKRRGSFATNCNSNYSNDDNNNTKKKMMMKMKVKTQKKCYDSNERDDEEDNKDEEEMVVIKETKQKKVRGGAIMEGSRCSRVNGRGWRCCQQTLVGYSLCEHHLGKGRLRSMASVRNRSLAAAKNNNVQHMPIPPSIEMKTMFDSEDNDDDDDDDEKKKPLMIAKKRMKLGMVKARSMSSLLGQTNIDLAIAEYNK